MCVYLCFCFLISHLYLGSVVVHSRIKTIQLFGIRWLKYARARAHFRHIRKFFSIKVLLEFGRSLARSLVYLFIWWLLLSKCARKSIYSQKSNTNLQTKGSNALKMVSHVYLCVYVLFSSLFPLTSMPCIWHWFTDNSKNKIVIVSRAIIFLLAHIYQSKSVVSNRICIHRENIHSNIYSYGLS